MVAWAEKNVKSLSLRQIIAIYWPAGALLAVVGLALVGQVLLSGREYVWPGVLCFGAATVLFLLLTWRRGLALLVPEEVAPPAVTPDRPLAQSGFLRLSLAGWGMLLALVAYQGFAGNRLDGGLLPWLAALLLFVLAFAERPVLARPANVDRRVLVALLGITLLGVFFRVYRLEAIPPEMTSDHAEKLLDVDDVLNGLRPIFFTRNTGREFVQFYLTAALIELTPLTVSHLALKVGTAIVGSLAVPFTYWLGRQEYGRLVGLLAAFFLAVSQWHVTITRVGLRFPFTATFAVPALFFLLRALRHNRRNDWLAAGLILGVGLHTYTAVRIVPLLFLLLVGLKVALDVWEWRRMRAPAGEQSALQWAFWRNALVGGVAALLVFLPLLRFMREFPDQFWYRAQSRSLVEAGLSGWYLWRTFWGNVGNALLMFNYRGDVVPMNTVPEAAVLGVVSGGLFVLGVVFLLWRLVRLRRRRDLYLLVALFTLLLPSILSLAFPGENPSVVRAGGAVPLVMIVVALPLAAMLRWLWGLGKRPGRGLAVGLLSVLLLVAVADNYHYYFVEYYENTRRSLWNTMQMGEVVREFVAAGGEMKDVYHVPYPHWVDTRNIGINAGDVRWNNAIIDMRLVRRHTADPVAKLYLVHPYDENAQKLLGDLFPAGVWELYDSRLPGKDFLIFRVPAREE